MDKISIGLIGLGTVGSGVVKTLEKFENINISKIAVRNLAKKRNIEGLDENILTDDPFSIVNDEDIKIVVEVMGGVNPALDLIKTAIKNKKHIVTANKELLAKYGDELYALANENNVVILYEAAIAGGIPIIMPIKTILAANEIFQIAGILNGTTNYILTKMDELGVSYKDVLEDAQKLGYAEADPTGDVEGYDAAYKIATLASLAFHQKVDINKIYKEGITKITIDDIKTAKELGYKIKLIAIANKTDDGRLDIRVQPMFVPMENSLSKIDNVTNAVLLNGFPVGEIMFVGAGAGEFPTASSVCGDILAIAAELPNTLTPLPMMRTNNKNQAEQIDINETYNKYYISIKAADNVGVIGFIGATCGYNNINLENMLQKGIDKDGTARIIVITGLCKEEHIRRAIKEIQSNNSIKEVTSLIRVMENANKE
ncbi:homoserine dehydrogenase [bacterium]|nr:homoserine dehydrogenase [bacterium]